MKRDPRNGRQLVHRILLWEAERQTVVDVLAADNRHLMASEVGAIVRLSQPCPDAPEFIDVFLDEPQRFVAFEALMIGQNRGPLVEMFRDYQLDFAKLGDILDVDMRGYVSGLRKLLNDGRYMNAPHVNALKRAGNLGIFSALERAEVGKIWRSESGSTVYFDYNTSAYCHPHRRRVPEHLVAEDAAALAQFGT